MVDALYALTADKYPPTTFTSDDPLLDTPADTFDFEISMSLSTLLIVSVTTAELFPFSISTNPPPGLSLDGLWNNGLFTDTSV